MQSAAAYLEHKTRQPPNFSATQAKPPQNCSAANRNRSSRTQRTCPLSRSTPQNTVPKNNTTVTIIPFYPKTQKPNSSSSAASAPKHGTHAS
ncbi:Uncharacterised protein [Neisseria gonorrhoeae]|uniref:Uncharacterized protein n=1 Tax=Neisseria gonorrhoeae TaxID=485 RepID=A0A378W0Z5_NEIGO|nr:Uncharacterised protein [Neisseria gonorrhoeae]